MFANTRSIRPSAISRWVLAALLVGAAVILGARAHADDTDDADPANRVARLSYLKGEVYLQPAQADAWTDAEINRPLTSGDQVWTASSGRAELQIGSSSLQLDDNTQLRLLELSDNVLQAQVTQGSVNVYVHELSKRDTVEIDTPNAAVAAMAKGTYRITLDGNSTLIQVRDGSADVYGERQSFTVNAGEQLTLRGDDRLSSSYDDLARMDEFDRWAADRNERAERVTSARYVNSDVIGYEDLDGYGYWRWYADFGYVWVPNRIAIDWAPYRYGHWVWVAPWGWTWVDNAPWGFAPFHYGRWTQISNHWCWVPGPRAVRPVYAPALVAWIGSPGLSVSISLGSPNVGWIPLGPREIYRPAYRSSHNYVVNVNLSNSRLDQNEFDRGYKRQPHEVDYRNRAAVSVVPVKDFGAARPVSDHLLRVDPARVEIKDQAPTITPQRNALIGGEHERDVPTVNERSVVSRRQPALPIKSDAPNTARAATSDHNAGDSNDNGVTARSNIRIITPPSTQRQLTREQYDSRSTSNSANNEDSKRHVITVPSQPTTTERGQGVSVQSNRDDDANWPTRNTRSVISTPAIRPDVKTPLDTRVPNSVHENTMERVESSNRSTVSGNRTPSADSRAEVTQPARSPAQSPDKNSSNANDKSNSRKNKRREDENLELQQNR